MHSQHDCRRAEKRWGPGLFNAPSAATGVRGNASEAADRSGFAEAPLGRGRRSWRMYVARVARFWN